MTQGRLDFDILGMAHPKFPHKMVLNQLPRNCGIGAFAWGVFGTRRMFINRLKDYCESGKVRFVRIQAYWDDNKATPPLDQRLVKIPFLKKVCEVVRSFADTYPRIKFAVSHTREYYSRNAVAVNKRVEVMREILGRKIITVNSPINGIYVAADCLERHGNITPPAGQMVSMDGKDATEINVQRWLDNNRDCLFRGLWIHSFNLRIKGKTPPPRPERDVRVTRDEMQWLSGFKG
jgi:hypothetical protein